MGRRIARVTADFIFIDEGDERLGKLGLHLAEGKDGWEDRGRIILLRRGMNIRRPHRIAAQELPK